MFIAVFLLQLDLKDKCQPSTFSVSKHVDNFINIDILLLINVHQSETAHALRSHRAPEIGFDPAHGRERSLCGRRRNWHHNQNHHTHSDVRE